MTDAQKRSVGQLQEWLREHAADGRWVSLFGVFGGCGNRATAHRRNVGRAWQCDAGLHLYGIAFMCGMARLCPREEIDRAEHDFFFNDPSLDEGTRQSRAACGMPVSMRRLGLKAFP